MKILLTGATGFIGSHVFSRLTEEGYQVTGVSLNDVKINGQKISGLDLTDEKKVKEFFKRRSFGCFIHLAAKVPKDFTGKEARQAFGQNLQATFNLLEEFANSGANKFIHASSISVRHPDNFYSLGKLFEEELARLYQKETGKKIISLRIAAPYGPGQNIMTVVPLFIKNAINNKPIVVFGSGQRRQDFIFVTDVAEAILKAMTSQVSGVYDIGGGESVSTLGLAKIIIKVARSKSKIIFKGKDAQEHYRLKIDLSQAKKGIGFLPRISLKEGIEKYIEYLKKVR